MAISRPQTVTNHSPLHPRKVKNSQQTQNHNSIYDTKDITTQAHTCAVVLVPSVSTQEVNHPFLDPKQSPQLGHHKKSETVTKTKPTPTYMTQVASQYKPTPSRSRWCRLFVWGGPFDHGMAQTPQKELKEPIFSPKRVECAAVLVATMANPILF